MSAEQLRPGQENSAAAVLLTRLVRFLQKADAHS